MSSSLGEIQTAAKLRDIVTSIAITTVDKLRPAEKIGKVYSVDYERSVAKIYFPGESIDSLIEARFAADKIPTEAMITTFDTLGYNATGNIVRVAGGPGSYYISDYVSGIPAIDPSARALVLTNTIVINGNVTTVSNATAANTASLNTLNGTTIPGLQSQLTTLNTVTIPQLQTDLGVANADIDALENVTIPALNTRLTTAESDIAAAEADVATLEGKFPIVGTDITDGAISTPKMTANTINGDRITANTLNASKIVAGSITTDRMTANTIDGSVITANTLNADRIVAGSITTDRMTANTINGDRINTNTLNADRIVAGSIATDRMTANTINGDRLTVNTLNGDRIIANTVTASRLNIIAGGGNLLLNSSFENSTSYITNWSKYDNSGVATLSSTTGRRTGTAVRLSWSAAAQVVGLYQTVTGGFKGSTYYMLSFYSKASGGAVGGTMVTLGNAPVVVATWVSNPALTTDWQRYVAIYTRAGDTNDPLYFGIASGYGTAGVAKTLDFDDVQLEEGNVVTAYSPMTDEILPGTVVAGMIQANAINGMTITGVTITGTSSITGAVVRTAASGARVEMNNTYATRINWYDSAGNLDHYIAGTDTAFVIDTQCGFVQFSGPGGTCQVRAGTLSLTGNMQSYGDSRVDYNVGNYSVYGQPADNQFRAYQVNNNRAWWQYGTGWYSTEGSLSVGCEIYGAFVTWSDLKDKSDLKSFGRSKDLIRKKAPSADSALDMMRKLPVYDYDTKHGGAGKGKDSKNVLVPKRGIIAQDLQAVAPHLVHDETDDPNTGFGLGVDVYGLLASAIEAIRELDEEVEQLKKEKTK